MAAERASAMPPVQAKELTLTRVATFPRMRALAWCDEVLYASRGYTLMRARMGAGGIDWQLVALYHPAWWRNLSSSSRLTFRLFRDGFHTLAVLSSGDLVAAVPGVILTLVVGEAEFRVTHKVARGTRPLHIAVTQGDHVFWGEYFDNPQRDQVHIYASSDRGATWNVAYTFPKGAIRHVHNIVYDRWEDCLWILTGDNGPECRILRVSCDFRSVDVVLSGNQQARAVALVPAPDAVYFSSDTPSEVNHVYRLDRRGNLAQLAELSSSSIYGCRVGEAVFFSTMVEPSRTNASREVCVYGTADGGRWQRQLAYRKDAWPMGLFQYGNAFLPDGRNTSGLLAVSTVAVEDADLETSLWRVSAT
ncbi:MAG: hypothetical protein LAN63_06015 [Acidobacteriia bacterium]|nr:hypothetical protein [Terriglobia bacterium]